MKKLLIAADNFIPRHDGIAIFLKEVIPELKKKFKITVIAPNFGLKRQDIKKYFSGVKLILFPLYQRKYGDFQVAKISIRKIREEVKKADIVWCHEISPIGLNTLISAWWHNKKRIAHIHSVEYKLVPLALHTSGFVKWVIEQIVKFRVRLAYNLSSALIVPSFEVADLLESMGVKTDKYIITVGVDSKRFKPPKNKARAKEKLGISKDSIVIGYCNRLSYEKDPLTLLRAFNMIKKNENVVLLVVGSGVKEIEQKFKKVKGVKFVGAKDNVVPYLQAMDIFVTPSLTETSSLATMEAMSCGVVPVTTNAGSLKRYVRSGYNGFIFEKGNVRDLINKLSSLILMMKNNRKEFNRLSKNARLTMIKRYNIRETIEKTKNVLLKF